MPSKRRPRGAGIVRQLPSGRWQARHTGPDGITRPAPDTFGTKIDAVAWLNAQVRLVDAGAWSAPSAASRATTLREYAESWLGIWGATRIKPRTAAQYRWLLDTYILPGLGGLRLDTITTPVVRTWHAGVAPGRDTTRVQAYGLLRTILGTAVEDGAIAANPCIIRGAGTRKATTERPIASPAEVLALADAIAPRYRVAVLLAGLCGLRFGELAELRRGDVDLPAAVVHVRRAVVRVNGVPIVGTPKSDAGMRTVDLPSMVVDELREHLARRVGAEAGALLVPAAHGGHLAPATLAKVWYAARAKVGRNDLRWHDLRHSALTNAAATGATLADIKRYAGHSTFEAAVRYQHSTQTGGRRIADGVQAMTENKPAGLSLVV